MKRLPAVVLVLFALACGGGTSTKSGPVAPTPTRVINVTGDLNFGQVTVGDGPTRSITITNSGTGTLTITTLTRPCTAFFFPSWSTGAISAGASQTVSLRFSPTAAQNCTGVVTANGDQTSGISTVGVIATAVAGYSRILTGRWRGTIGADTLITLTQSASNLSGTFDSSNRKGSVSGSLSNRGVVTLTVTVPGSQPFTLTGQADDAGTTISGQVTGAGFQNTPFTLRRV